MASTRETSRLLRSAKSTTTGRGGGFAGARAGGVSRGTGGRRGSAGRGGG